MESGNRRAARPHLPGRDRAHAGRGCGWRRLLDHLAQAGPSSPEDLRLELGLKRQELKALRAPLERCGALVARSVTMREGDGEAHTHSEARRWFSWQWYWTDTLIADLIRAGMISSFTGGGIPVSDPG